MPLQSLPLLQDMIISSLFYQMDLNDADRLIKQMPRNGWERYAPEVIAGSDTSGA